MKAWLHRHPVAKFVLAVLMVVSVPVWLPAFALILAVGTIVSLAYESVDELTKP